MDIDSVDVDVTLAVLSAGYSPAFIFVELNEKVPPPICYCNRHVSPPRRWERLGGHHYGCSLTGFVNALAPQGYRLVSVILNDALFVHQRHAPQVARRLPGGVLPSPEAAFAAGYRDVPGRPIHYSWNSDTNPNATSRPTSNPNIKPSPEPHAYPANPNPSPNPHQVEQRRRPLA